jgi:hypothetical protein
MTNTLRLSTLLVLLALACGTEPPASELVRIHREASPEQVALAGETEDAAPVQALFARDHEHAKIELEQDGDRFVARLDPRAGELAIDAEIDGASVHWTSADGPVDERIAQRWSDVLAAWREHMLDGDGQLRAEARSSVNVPADLFTTQVNGVPVSDALWCPPVEVCWYDDVTATEICEFVAAVWCPPPCWGSDCDPCGGLYCPPPEPCDTWLCPEPCIGLWCP